MTRLRERADVYTCTALGHRDRVTGNIFKPDMVATVEDDFTGCTGDWWVSSRTFRKSLSGGTTTDLTLLPKHRIQFSDVDNQ